MEINKDKLYVNMLRDVLVQKDTLMDELIDLTKQQELVLKESEFMEDSFSELISKKDQALKHLNELDGGFDSLYQKVQNELTTKKYQYKEQILDMQSRIKGTVEKGILLKSLELRNQKLLEICLNNARTKAKSFRQNSQAVSSYYKNMAKVQTGESYFMDNKR